MFYLKLFKTEEERQACTDTQEYVSYTEDTDNVNIHPYDYSQEYLTFVAKQSGTFQFSGTSTANTISYSTDNGTTWSTPAQEATVEVNSGDNVLWKGEMTPSSNGIGKFSGTASFDAQGNIMSLLYGDNLVNQTDLTGKKYAFRGLFFESKVVNANNLVLQATTLASSCYYSMFANCTSLITAPQLPATTLAQSCYSEMFNYCSKLVNAPTILPATTLVNGCYAVMFYGCTSLTTAPELPATTLANFCYSTMFSGCTNLNYIKAMFTTTPSDTYTPNWVSGVATTGTFVKNSAAQWDVRGDNGVPNGWTVQTAS